MKPMINLIKTTLTCAIISFFVLSNHALAQDEDIYEMSLEDVMNLSLNKASVIGLPHPHTKGEWMLSYQFMNMNMTDILDGTEKITQQDVLDRQIMNQNEFMMTPTSMSMNMYMFMIMYAPTDHLTLMVMSMYKQASMSMLGRSMMGMDAPTMEMESSGISDMEIMANMAVLNKDEASVLVNVGLSLPLGSIDEMGMDMMTNENEVTLPYPMQMGSGTVDPRVELVYLRSTMKTSFGVASRNKFRVYDNKNDYRLGNHYSVIMGYGYNWTKWLATTARLDFNRWNNIEGADESVNPMLSPMGRTDLRAITRLDGSAGIVLEVPKGTFKDVALIFDYRTPLYQKLDGPQMGFSPHWMLTLQWIHGKKTLH